MTISERRHDIRLAIEMFVDESREGELYFQRTANLSRGGMYLEHTIPHPVGTVVQLAFKLPGDSETLRARAEIVNAATDLGSLGMGLKFIDPPPAMIDKIEAFISKMTK